VKALRFKARLSAAWAGFNRAVEDYGTYASTFGYVRGASFFLAGRRLANLGRRVELMIPGTDIPLMLRIGTSDVEVFREIFVNLEYGWKFSSPPRVVLDVGGYTGQSAASSRTPTRRRRLSSSNQIRRTSKCFCITQRSSRTCPQYARRLWKESGSISLTDPGLGPWGLQVSEASDALPVEDLIRAVTIDEIRKEFNLDRIDLLKVDVEGSEKEIFHSGDAWLPFVDVICIELHDRFKVGCSRSFYRAVEDFPIEIRRNEDVLVARSDSRLVPLRAVN